MSYTNTQIKATKENAKLLGFKTVPTKDQSIAFLDWYHSAKTEYQDVISASIAGINGRSTTGIRQKIATWEKILGETPAPPESSDRH